MRLPRLLSPPLHCGLQRRERLWSSHGGQESCHQHRAVAGTVTVGVEDSKGLTKEKNSDVPGPAPEQGGHGVHEDNGLAVLTQPPCVCRWPCRLSMWPQPGRGPGIWGPHLPLPPPTPTSLETVCLPGPVSVPSLPERVPGGSWRRGCGRSPVPGVPRTSSQQGTSSQVQGEATI